MPTTNQDAQSAKNADMRASANGYLLTVNGYELHASWAAPWFVLALDDPEAPDYDPEPWLIHCETLADAHQKRGNFWRTILLRHDFTEAPWLAVPATTEEN